MSSNKQHGINMSSQLYSLEEFKSRTDLLSKSQWLRSGRVPIDQDQYTAIVYRDWGWVAPPANCWQIVLPMEHPKGWIAVVLDDAGNSWKVYSLDQTRLIDSQLISSLKSDSPSPSPHLINTVNLNQSETHSTPSPTTMVNHSKYAMNQGVFASTGLSENREVNNDGIKVYLPENLTIPDNVKQWENDIKLFVNTIYWERNDSRLPISDFVPLKAEYLRNIIPDFRYFWSKVNGWLIERDNYYIEGVKSYGYRLNPKFWTTHRLNYISSNKRQQRQTIKTAQSIKGIHKVLRDNLDHLTIDTESFHQRFKDCTHYPMMSELVQTINDKQWRYKAGDDFGQRVHSQVTRTWRLMRGLYRCDGQRLSEVDISNSQPIFIGVECRKQVDCLDYLDVVQAGQLYETLAAATGLARDHIKEELIKSLYAKPKYSNVTKQAFNQLYPEVGDWINRMKARDHKRLSRLIQRAESKLIIHGVCPILAKRGVWCATVHDSILCLQSDVSTVAEVISHCFGVHDIIAPMKIKIYDEAHDHEIDNQIKQEGKYNERN